MEWLTGVASQGPVKAVGLKFDFRRISIYASVSSRKDRLWIWGIKTQRFECNSQQVSNTYHMMILKRHLSFYGTGSLAGRNQKRHWTVCVPGQLGRRWWQLGSPLSQKHLGSLPVSLGLSQLCKQGQSGASNLYSTANLPGFTLIYHLNGELKILAPIHIIVVMYQTTCRLFFSFFQIKKMWWHKYDTNFFISQNWNSAPMKQLPSLPPHSVYSNILSLNCLFVTCCRSRRERHL